MRPYQGGGEAAGAIAPLALKVGNNCPPSNTLIYINFTTATLNINYPRDISKARGNF